MLTEPRCPCSLLPGLQAAHLAAAAGVEPPDTGQPVRPMAAFIVWLSFFTCRGPASRCPDSEQRRGVTRGSASRGLCSAASAELGVAACLPLRPGRCAPFFPPHRSGGWGPVLMTSFELNHIFKGPRSSEVQIMQAHSLAPNVSGQLR